MVALNTAVVTFFYPSITKYLPQFVATLNAQTDLNYTLVVFNDNVNIEFLSDFFESLLVEYYVIPVTGNPVEIRVKALEFLQIANFDTIIFQDSDDLMTHNRVEVLANLLSKHQFVVNDLDIADEDGIVYQSAFWKENFVGKSSFSYLDIFNKNFAGLSNTAVQQSILIGIDFKTRAELNVADWYVFFLMLYRHDCKGIFTSLTKTIYRQHNRNLIGINNGDQEKKEIGGQVKKSQLAALSDKLGVEAVLKIKNLYKDHKDIKSKGSLFWWE